MGKPSGQLKGVVYLERNIKHCKDAVLRKRISKAAALGKSLYYADSVRASLMYKVIHI